MSHVPAEKNVRLVRAIFREPSLSYDFSIFLLTLVHFTYHRSTVNLRCCLRELFVGYPWNVEGLLRHLVSIQLDITLPNRRKGTVLTPF